MGDGAVLCRSAADAAAHIRTTAHWEDDRWREVSIRAIDRAFSCSTSLETSEAMVRDWRQLGLAPSPR